MAPSFVQNPLLYGLLARTTGVATPPYTSLMGAYWPSQGGLLTAPVTDADLYLRKILQREAVDTGIFSPASQVQTLVQPTIQRWANRFFIGMAPSGSFAKGTANRSGTDIDLFISVSPDTPETLSQIYNKLDDFLRGEGFATRRQNVSIGITVAGQQVDLVPGKMQHYFSNDHSLYRRKADTWTKTNVWQHAQHIQASGRKEEIRILKLWRDQSGLDFPSFYLELVVLRALSKTLLTSAPHGTLAANVWEVLAYLGSDAFTRAYILDPANTNNVISDDLTAGEKEAIRLAAAATLKASTWNQVVW